MGKKTKTKILHLGCGLDKLPNAIGIDINPRSQADVIHNLDKFPYPFKANQFDEIIADNIIEHLEDIIKVMEELHRITKNHGKIYIKTGHFSSVDSFNDPTHKHFFTSRSFDYFIPGTKLYKYKYSKIKFKKIKVLVGPFETKNILLKILLFTINKLTLIYERRFAFIFPVGTITYELEVIKN
jgi:SAM-dependent methyltransferase